ncbi:DUF3826 domain-containing protein [Parafilimonas terrae]|uniref:DUF3826 domain-containing protein n=1 Tax=Parafilimonas terrae TaxID=1465490 RepID=A0A1I5TNP3_9BACT|nr:DUF3826 domain-containing protein [Parafilimonas terrae]SFP84598.1 Protein of unknown function [Parafilimonas terrae]
MKKRLKLLGAAILVLSIKTSAQNSEIVQDTAYMNVVQQRAAKIVDKMGLSGAAQKKSIQNKIAWQYYNLNEIYKKRDSALSILKTDTANKAARKQRITEAAEKSVDSLHPVFLTELAKEIDTVQVNAVKDGMTYDVLHVTYKAYQEMLPDLTTGQKQQIYNWLVEAREHAMDAESSEKKHAWFGKYKGRINNYLSAQGINMKQATLDWQKRIREKRE